MAENQITLIGCGKMGSAMLEGWLGDASLDAQFTIIEPDQSHLGWVANEPRVSLYQDCAAAIANNAKASTMIVLAVKPQMMDNTWPPSGIECRSQRLPIHRRRYFNSLVETTPWFRCCSNACNAKHTGGCW